MSYIEFVIVFVCVPYLPEPVTDKDYPTVRDGDEKIYGNSYDNSNN
jgi:hypothetical protein